MKYCLITGSGGLVGSESVRFFCDNGYTVIGIENNMREYFFGTSTSSITDELVVRYPEQFLHKSVDIRNKSELEEIFNSYKTNIECIIHCAAQPSHDWAAKEPHTDFEINALATLNLLELTRNHCPKASFIFMSTNKVYGDRPNYLPLKELDTRYEITGNTGTIDETMSVDQCKHSLFGVSKLAADMMVQEYGRYFGMNTVVFRGGCITGPNHQGAQLHGFLSYIVKCIVTNQHYKIFGYKGKQVRDNIHSYDLVNAFWNYHKNPRPAAVYNIGGGRENSLSILETIGLVNELTGKYWDNYEYCEEERAGDHIWYISNLAKFKADYPDWSITVPIRRILQDIICAVSPQTITVNLIGGVGNQLFQIAAAYALSRDLSVDLKFQRNQFSGCRQGTHPTKYYSNLFQKLTFVDSLSIQTTIKEAQWTYSPLDQEAKVQFTHNSVVCLDGYFQSDHYFKKYSNEIKALFIPNGGILSYLEQHTNVLDRFPELKGDHSYAFMGIRRGDYITYSEFHNPCGLTFYRAAMDKIPAERYYILTDDFEWAKKNFVGEQFRFLEIKDDLHQLLTSTLFKNYIISNSSFYWWGSFLSIYEKPKIIAPDKWIFGSDVKREQYWSIYRDDMEIIERSIEID